MVLLADLRVIRQCDPAAKTWLEVLFCYPGFHALLFHRVAHLLHRVRIPLLPRLIAHLSRFLTGIEIHPGATKALHPVLTERWEHQFVQVQSEGDQVIEEFLNGAGI